MFNRALGSAISRSVVTPHARRSVSARPPGRLEAASQLQQAIGNRAFATLVNGRPLQRKLQVNEPGDEFERQADCVADSVVASSTPTSHLSEEEQISAATGSPLQRCACGGTCSDCRQHDEEATLQRKQDGSSGPTGREAPSIVHQTLGRGGRRYLGEWSFTLSREECSCLFDS